MDPGKRWNHFEAEMDQAHPVAVHLLVLARAAVVPAAVHSTVVASAAVDRVSATFLHLRRFYIFRSSMGNSSNIGNQT